MTAIILLFLYYFAVVITNIAFLFLPNSHFTVANLRLARVCESFPFFCLTFHSAKRSFTMLLLGFVCDLMLARFNTFRSSSIPFAVSIFIVMI
jgi:hypothetical protein